jgi:hypothetical protein
MTAAPGTIPVAVGIPPVPPGVVVTAILLPPIHTDAGSIAVNLAVIPALPGPAVETIDILSIFVEEACTPVRFGFLGVYPLRPRYQESRCRQDGKTDPKKRTRLHISLPSVVVLNII